MLAKSIALLNMNRYDECITVSKQMIATNKNQAEPYFNIATCYLNQALALEQLNEPRKYREQLVKLYSDACPYMEKYRELAPFDSQRWGPALYRVYLNLNKGKQFEEIDRLMRKN
jgi:tetratricopeptide (TPR) repeat protein